jgi:hypothetical protein
MVGNGRTWALTPKDLYPRDSPAVDVIDISRTGNNRIVKDTMVIANDSFKIVRNGDNWGWTSVACGSDSGGWLNLVIYDGAQLAQVLTEAVGRHRRDYPTIEVIISTRPFPDPASGTFGELLRQVVTDEPSETRTDSVGKLESVTTLWGMIFERFDLGEGSCPNELAMLMYADRLSTYALLEGGAFLPIGANSANVHRDDLRLASCLRRLRSMTSWVSPYTDIDKRCREAIVAHVELRPSLRGFYGSACTN